MFCVSFMKFTIYAYTYAIYGCDMKDKNHPLNIVEKKIE